MLKILRLFLIIVAIIFVGIIIINKGLKLLEQKKYEDIRTDLLLVQAKIKIIKGKSQVNNNMEAYVGSCVAEYNNEDIRDFLKTLHIDEANFGKYYVLNYQDFEKMGIVQDLKYKDDNNIIVNYDTADVIYKEGVTVDGTCKYKLSELVEKKEKKIWILHNRMME